LRGGEFKESADLGTVYHKLQQHGPDEKGIQKVQTWLKKKQAKLMASADAGEDLDGNMVRTANALTTSFDRALVMSRIFWEKFPQPDFLETVAAEVKHKVLWNGMILSGTIDKIILNHRLRPRQKLPDVWIRDHKSTGKKTLAPVFGGLSWSIQGRVYRILGNHWVSKKLKGKTGKVRGFILDGILKPGIKCCKKDEKNAKEWNMSLEDAYMKRVKDWYEEYEKKNEAKALNSQSVVFNEPIFNDELVEHLGMIKELVSRPLVPKNFPRDVTRYACFQYEKQCIYHDLCATPPALWGPLFEYRYKQVLEDGEDGEV
jgi:hypothetical protein